MKKLSKLIIPNKLENFPNQKYCGINRALNRVKIARFTHDFFSIFSYANELNKSCF